MLEAKSHDYSTFATLTIEDKHLTWGLDWDCCPIPTVVPRDVQLLVKRMRKLATFRHVTIGEYGNQTDRPHYHMLLFGLDPFQAEELLLKEWKKGFVQVAEMNEQRACYMAGYTTKKLTKLDDDRLQRGQYPEFMRQSLKPFIGAPYLDHLEALHYTAGGARELAETGDVASVARIDGKIWPLDRTMRIHLRRRLGVPEVDHRRRKTMDPMTMDEWQTAQLADARMRRRSRRPGEVM